MLTDIQKVDDKILKLVFKVNEKHFDKAISNVFLETKDKYKVPGMQTGMIPQYIIEKTYGEEVFYNDALIYLIEEELRIINNTYKKYEITNESIYNINIIQMEKHKELIFELLVYANR